MTPSGPVPRPLSTFLMDDTTRATLAAAGARNSLDVLRMAASGNDTAASVARQAGPAGFSSLSALDSLKRERTRKTISTGSKALDGILGSGFSCGQVVEVAGPPGLGKTQFGMQMCINVQMPVDKGGADGDAIYIDTEGSFSVTRVAEMSLAAIDASCSMIACQPNREQMLDAMLDRIKLFRVHDHVEQIALLNQLEDVIRNNGKIKLIVLDSIAFHFRSLKIGVCGHVANVDTPNTDKDSLIWAYVHVC
ncbi:P-loop containing nucleoside triphosphate hydrolase protein [Chytriomyces sp. MP71]|nr:P-loop containing nucleoside triphosphate hydrolase protein [Chytriomyces sp. MP71]